jgi:hypothetical protein
MVLKVPSPKLQFREDTIPLEVSVNVTVSGVMPELLSTVNPATGAGGVTVM